VAQELPFNHVVTLNAYYKDATNMLDDAQLPGSSVAQPYNKAVGYAWGIEFQAKGQFTDDLTHFVTYTHSIAKGKGTSGGIFALSSPPSDTYQFLDHCQTDTANAGVTWRKYGFWTTVQGLFGSGLRTGPDNNISLPSHFTFNATVGYEWKGPEWYKNVKVYGDVLNIFDNAYPITIANGYNGSHYAAGRQYFIHLVKEF